MNTDQIIVLLFVLFIAAVIIDGFVRQWIANERIRKSNTGEGNNHVSGWTFAEK